MAKCLKANESFVEYERGEQSCPTVPARFEKQAAKDPGQLALHTKNYTLTYEQLNRAANAIALAILAQRGTGHEPIALLLENDAPMIEALLGVLKAGKTYVPLDPSLPQSRLSYILDDTQAALLVTNARNAQLADSLTHGRVPLIDVDQLDRRSGADNPGIFISPDTPTWILYTSGSTGQPKGVLQTHRNVLHFVRNYTNGLYLSSTDRMALLYSFGVNGAAHEMFSALLNGASLHTLDIKVEGVTALAGWLEREQVTTYSSVPTVFRHFCETLTGNEQLSALRFVKLIGEPVSKKEVELFQKYFPSTCMLINRLGSTETGTIRWYFIDKETRIEGSSVPVGYAVADNEVLLLDDQKKEVAAGEIGEIAVRSRYLSPGYWRKPDQTRKAFLADSNGSDERTYLTGDLGRMMPDGCLLHLGRKDFQVKIRGHRIETGEVETALLDVSGATQAIVMARDDEHGEPRLVAYLLIAGRTKPGVSSLRRGLAERLPAYMIPSAYVMLDSFPVAPNGKVNRSALPLPNSSRPELENAFVAPSNATELKLTEIWSSVLGVHPVGIHDDFFELGGHSLAAAQVVSRALETFQREIAIKALFEAPTVAAMAKDLDLEGQVPPQRVRSPITPAPRTCALPLSFAQERLWFVEQFAPNTAGYNIVSAIRLKGPLQPDIVHKTLNAIAQRHEVLRTRFVENGGQPVQIVEETVTIELPQVDLTSFPEPRREVEARKLATADAQVPFDLTRAPLFRARLLRLDASDHVLVTVIHHIVSDGWSAKVFAKDFCAYFVAFSEKKAAAISDLPIQYGDFAVWQRKSLQYDRLESDLSYWRNRLSGIPPSELPPDRARPPIQTYRGAKKSQVLSSGTSNSLDALSRQERATLFTTLLSAFIVHLRRNIGRADVLIGTDVANRSRVETENLIGFFVNLLPVHARVSGDPTFRELLRDLRDTMFEAYAHQDVPFDRLVAALNPKRDRSRNPLFQILFVLQSEPDYSRLPSLMVDTFDVDGGTARFDLVVFVAERNHQLTATWNYNSDLYTEATVTRMMIQFEVLLESIAASPDSHVNSLPITREPDTTEVTRVSRLRAVRRKAVDLSRMKLVTTSHLTADDTLPLVIQPCADDVDLLDWAKHNCELIEAELSKHGALLFRGFGLKSIEEFESFAAAICPGLFVDYGDLPREQVGRKVYKSTPYPADKRILFHNESSHMHQWPLKQWFFCVEAAKSGGETPIVDCRKAYERIDPEIVKRFEQCGIMYVRNFTDDLDVRWQDFFKTSDPNEVENYCRNAFIDFEWKGKNALRIRHVSPAVIKHPKTGEKVWFNQIQHWHLSCLDQATRKSLLSLFGTQDLPRSCYYGDGSPIEDSVVEHISDVYRKTAVEFPWQEHDILMVDNMLVAHARNSYLGARKVVVAMGEMMSLSRCENQNP